MKASSDKTILLMAGGTGGHIFPALAVAKELQKDGWNLHWLGSQGGMEQELIQKHNIEMTLLPISGVRGKGFLSLLKAPFLLLRSIWQARAAIKNIKPSVALGMGGFASGPGGFAARLCSVPLVIHEQNAISGMTNRMLHKLSHLTIQAYPGAFAASEKVKTLGNPVRQDFNAIAEPALRLKEQDSFLKVLVVGGSRGAEVLNRVMPQTMDIINDGLHLTVMHQAGKGKKESVMKAYQNIGNDRVRFEVVEFIEDMAKDYAWADLVICRAGALTVAEIAMAGCAAIFVPYPHAVDDHQTHNARYLSDQAAALIIQQHDLQAKALSEQITALANNKQHLIEMAVKAKTLAKPNATHDVAESCKSVANNNSIEGETV